MPEQKGAPVAECGLCQKVATLKNSHLLPQALYRFVQAKGKSLSSPVVITRKNAWSTDKQAVKYLLCGGCEQLLHRNGEDWTLRNIYRGSGCFRLLDTLNTLQPVATKSEARLYEVSNTPAVDISKLTYFGMSVFWRAAITSWRIEDQILPQVDMGAQYTTAIRDYLLGFSAFPSNLALSIEVCDDPTLAATTLATPAGCRDQGYYRCGFMVPGLAFHLFVGQRIPLAMKECCIASGSQRLILRRNYEEFLKTAFCQLMRSATPSSKLKQSII